MPDSAWANLPFGLKYRQPCPPQVKKKEMRFGVDVPTHTSLATSMKQSADEVALLKAHGLPQQG
jgi:hypothetical protein